MGERLSFGVDWYPEQWDESTWERDCERMRAQGVSVVRMMEFAWTIVEPEKGRYDFSLFERAIEVAASRGLKVILGTPTATFPAWLLDEGEVLMTSPEGRVRDFGARRMGCYNAPAYREAARKVAAEAAKRLGGHPAVEGWQVDNELGHEGSDRCVCGHCRAAWHAWLERRYGRIEALNAQWGNVFWGTTYGRFDQVPVPRRQVSVGFNPGLLLDYDRFMSDSAAAFVDAQVEALKAAIGPDRYVTTNLYPPPLSNAIDMERLTRDMDFASWDNYPVWGAQDEPFPHHFQAFAQSYVRGLRGSGPFTVMEEFSGIQGHVCLGALPPEGQVALWTVQAVARGANRIVYFRGRTAPYGQEQLCSGLLEADDGETSRSRVLAANAKRAKAELARLASVPFESDACLVYSKDDARVLREQYLSKGLYVKEAEWMQAGYDLELAKWFAPFAAFNVNADVKSAASVDVEKYALVSLPLYQMADPALVARLDAWVRRGGVLVLGYRSGARDPRNWNIAAPLPGLFSELAGVRVPAFESLNLTRTRLRLKGLPALVPAHAEVWADHLEPAGAEPIAWYSGRGKSCRGKPCATVNRVGRGKVFYIGTSPDPAAMFFLYRRILKEAGLSPRFLGKEAEVVERRTDEGARVRIALNHSPRPRRILGRRLPPWGWAVLE